MKPTLLLSVILFAICGFGYKAFSQIVYIPDANFKAYLVGNLSINTNGDGEIQTSEATSFTGTMNVSSKYITNLTGIETFTYLTNLYCGNNQLTSLNVSNNPLLNTLSCYNNQLTSLNVSANTALTNLNCSQNQLTSLNISSNTALIQLWCNNNQLSILNLSANTALTLLDCWNNKLTNLGLSSNTALNYLDSDENQLTSLNLSSNTSLTRLYCGHNQLTSLNLSTNTALTNLWCPVNQLLSLDLSANKFLTYLNCSWNQLTSLNVKNGNNTNFTYFNATNNPNLTCINVDNSIWSTANWTYIDAGASFSDNCYTEISELINPTELKIYPNPVQDELTINSSLRGVVRNEAKQSLQLVIFDLFGKDVLSTKITENEQSINLSNLASGLYTLKIITDSGIVVKKLVKN